VPSSKKSEREKGERGAWQLIVLQVTIRERSRGPMEEIPCSVSNKVKRLAVLFGVVKNIGGSLGLIKGESRGDLDF